MDAIALCIAIFAFLTFLYAALKPRPVDVVALGLALLSAAWICQLVAIAGDKIKA